MTFSRNSIIEALSLFEGWSTADFDRFLLRFGLENICPERIGSKPKRINALITHLIHNSNLIGPNGANIILEIIEYMLQSKSYWGYGFGPLNEKVPKLSHSLNLDGYSITEDGNLVKILPTTIPIAQSQNELELLLLKHKFVTTNGHLEQALSAHTRGDWAAANGQMRSFIESLFDEISDRLLPHPLPNTSDNRKSALARLNPPFIDPALNEWDLRSNSGFIQGFFKRLHPQGSHPGLSDEEDCTFRLQMIIIVAHFFVKRFDVYP